MSALRTPPLLLGAALLFWGWQSGWVLVGALMAVILEAARVVGLRWEFSEADFRRIWDFTVLLFGAAIIYLFASNEGPAALRNLVANPSTGTEGRVLNQTAQALLVLFRWTPMIFFLGVTAQAYSGRETLPWSVFSLVARRRLARQPRAAQEPGGVNTAYPYLGLTLLASSIPVRPDWTFSAGFSLLVGWTLWHQRSRRYAPVAWAATLVLALGIGFFAQQGFARVISWANLTTATWLGRLITVSTNPRESRTAIGEIGLVKLSGRIVLRLQPKEGEPAPALLREASYRWFKSRDWAGAGKATDFRPALWETNQTSWDLAPRAQVTGSATIAQYLTGRGEDARRGLLAVPQGIVRLDNLPAFQISTNRLGVVRVDEGPGLVIYEAQYRAGSTIDAPPAREDLEIPTNEELTLVQLTNELRLAGQSGDDILGAVRGFFLKNFEYTLWLPSGWRSHPELTPLGNFLLRQRKGHCEYFATAAVLLLRKAGLPARYAVGYSVQEKSGDTFIVRQRHAHAWCLVWMNGAWQDFDPTPPAWVAVEAGQASIFEWLGDAWSRLQFEVAKLRWGLTDWRRYILWAFIPILAVMLIRLFLGQRLRRLTTSKAAPVSVRAWPGLDSEYYRLEQELARAGLERGAQETPHDWLARLRGHPVFQSLGHPLGDILRLHYRHRFDPAGLAAEERQQLRTAVQTALERLPETLASRPPG